jgi:hypothetical protein
MNNAGMNNAGMNSGTGDNGRLTSDLTKAACGGGVREGR